MKKLKKILVCFLGLLLCLSLVGLFACNNEQTNKYTFTNSQTIPDYETDLFTIDGKLDEDIYDELRWWEGVYSEGQFEEPCYVKVTSYLGANGLYIAIDVIDDNVNVNPKRTSHTNSGVSVYLANFGTTSLRNNAWEIDISANGNVNAKRYLGDIGFSTYFAHGDINKPYAKSQTKGGELNSDDCTGYIVETYFTYDLLFGKDFAQDFSPEKLNLNFALIRSFSADNASRDLYYNFALNQTTNGSWGNPSTWWNFYKYGFDSVNIDVQSQAGGIIERESASIARNDSTEIAVVPYNGYRVDTVKIEQNGTTVDVTDALTFKAGKYYYKLFCVDVDTKVIADFEAVSAERKNLTGTVTYKGAALESGMISDLSVVYYDGGSAYTSALDAQGKYELSVPVENGTLEIYSENEGKVYYVAVAQDAETLNVDMTESNYGVNRTIALADATVMTTGTATYSDITLWDTLNNEFTYGFNLKYTGEAFDADGNLLDDPTFGQYANSLICTTVRLRFTNEEGEAVENCNVVFQLLHYSKTWSIKLFVDTFYSEIALPVEMIADLCDTGIDFYVVVANGMAEVRYEKDGVAFKVVDKEMTNSVNRYLRLIEISGENSVNNAKWSITKQELDFNKTGFGSIVPYQLASMSATEYSSATTDSGDKFKKTYAIIKNTGYVARYNVSSETLATAYTGSADKNVIYFNSYTNTDGSYVWGANFGVMLMYKADGLCLYGWSNSNWQNRTVYLTGNELDLLASADGLDIIFTYDGSEYAVWLEIADGEIAKVMYASASGKYFVGSIPNVYANNASVTVSAGMYAFSGSTVISDVLDAIFPSAYTLGNRLTVKQLVSETNVTTDQAKPYGTNVSNQGYLAKYTIKSSDLGTSNKGHAIYFNTYTNTDGSTTAGPNLGVMLTYSDAGNLAIKGWSSSSWTTIWYEFTSAQKELLASASGIDMLFTYDGNEYGVWLETSEGTIQKVMSSPSSWVAGKYISQANADFYETSAYTISMSYETYNVSNAGSMANIINAVYRNIYTIA